MWNFNITEYPIDYILPNTYRFVILRFSALQGWLSVSKGVNRCMQSWPANKNVRTVKTKSFIVVDLLLICCYYDLNSSNEHEYSNPYIPWKVKVSTPFFKDLWHNLHESKNESMSFLCSKLLIHCHLNINHSIQMGCIKRPNKQMIYYSPWSSF